MSQGRVFQELIDLNVGEGKEEVVEYGINQVSDTIHGALGEFHVDVSLHFHDVLFAHFNLTSPRMAYCSRWVSSCKRVRKQCVSQNAIGHVLVTS